MLQLSPTQITHLMQQALLQAEAAANLGEVPVGAVIWHKDRIIAQAHNLTERQQNPCAHAEVLAIKSAAACLSNWRLEECVLCVTLEPCTMCAGAIKLARIGCVIFGASDPNMGALGSIYDLGHNSQNGPVPRIISAIMQQECSSILQTFFKNRRK